MRSLKRNKMKKCFTINAMRNHNDFIGFNELLDKGLFKGIEIFYPYNVSSEQRALYERELKSLVDKHQDIEVVLHLPHGGANNLINSDYSENEEIIKRMKDAISFGSIYGAKKYTLHLGSAYKEENASRGKLIDALIKVLKDLTKYAGQALVMIENMPRDNELGYSPKEILDIITKVGSDNLTFIMDTGHAHVSCYEEEDYINTLGHVLTHMHFSDNNGLRDEHKPIGEGNIDFVKLFNNLKKINYSHLHCLEILFNDYHQLIDYAKRIEEFDYLYR